MLDDHQAGGNRTAEEDQVIAFDMMSDCRRLCSRIGEITSPSTSGAGSNSNLRSAVTQDARSA